MSQQFKALVEAVNAPRRGRGNFWPPLEFTSAVDAVIVQGRALGMAWESLGHALHTSAPRLRVYAQSVMGMAAFPPGFAGAPSDDPGAVARRARDRERERARPVTMQDRGEGIEQREPLPAGHPVTWGAISGIAWPQPEAMGR